MKKKKGKSYVTWRQDHHHVSTPARANDYFSVFTCAKNWSKLLESSPHFKFSSETLIPMVEYAIFTKCLLSPQIHMLKSLPPKRALASKTFGRCSTHEWD